MQHSDRNFELLRAAAGEGACPGSPPELEILGEGLVANQWLAIGK